MNNYLRFFFVFYVIFLINYSCNGQVGQWTWTNGSSTVGSSGNYGVQGVSSPTNEPPGMYEGCQWTDLNGNFWLYGGDAVAGFMADLWKYDPITNEWTWIKGPGGSVAWYAGSYGTKGVSSPTNNPPARSYGATTWTDTLNNLWLFGGLDFTNCNNDLWKYNIGTNEWTWVKGPNVNAQPGVYGKLNIPDTANNPGARYECAAAWTDNAGDLWLFGGYKSGKQNFNDLWRYNITNNIWTWMKGDSSVNQKGIYGVRTVEDPLNKPGARHAYTHWKDSVGNLWLFGGLSAIDSIIFNDMWRYNITTNNWTWMNGSNNATSTGDFETECIPNAAATPSSRFESRAVWQYQNNFFLFGGFYTYTATQQLNNLWKYCVASNTWIWQSGDTVGNPAGNWGTLGVSSPTNKPDGRGGGIGWSDNNGNIYMFGGWNYNNDLWKYAIDPACGTCTQALQPIAVFTSSDTAFCDEGGKCIDFTDHSTGNPTSWQWFFQGAVPDTSSLQNPTNICYYTPGTYSVKLIASNANGSDSMNVSPLIIFGSGAITPVLTLSHDTVFSSHASAYQWYYNGAPVSGATDSFYVAMLDGTYNVFITDNIGCSRLGDGLLFTSANEINNGSALMIYPNPANSEVTIKTFGIKENSKIDIYNVLGEEIYHDILNNNRKIINTKLFSEGIYFIKVNTEQKQVIKKLIIQHN